MASTEQFATERDFHSQRKFCAFRVVIDETNLIVEESGEAPITKDGRNGELRILWLGGIRSSAIKQLRLQSASLGSYTGYYVDYADNKEEAKRQVCIEARKLHKKMMDQFDLKLARMQATELTFVPRCKC
jgi:hypothetical protein